MVPQHDSGQDWFAILEEVWTTWWQRSRYGQRDERGQPSTTIGATMRYELRTINVRVDGGVAFATFDNPPINLVDPALIDDLIHFVAAVDEDEDVRVIVFDSADPDFFLAHADMVALGERAAGDAPPRDAAEQSPLSAVLERLSYLRQVSIAKIAGRARGAGSEMALACDMRFASAERTLLAQPEVAVGLLPGAGGTQRLPGLMGRGRALEAILGAEDFTAPLAERYGWINRALPDAELDEFVERLARRIASYPPEGVACAKQTTHRVSLPAHDGLVDESGRFAEALRSPAVAERAGRLLARGGQTRGEVELDLGRVLGEPL